MAWSLATARSTAQDATGTIAWRGRNVAGREVVVDWTVREKNLFGREGEHAERSGELRDFVVAAGPKGGRGMRITRETGGHPNSMALEFFDVDGTGVVRAFVGFGVGPGHPSPHAPWCIDLSSVGWMRRLPFAGDLRPGTTLPDQELRLDDGPPRFTDGSGPSLEVSACVTESTDGARIVAIAPTESLPFDVQQWGMTRRIERFQWFATVDARGVLIGEERALKWKTLVSRALADYEDDRCSWREAEVRKVEGEELATLCNEADLLRRAYEVLSGDPREALRRLDDFDALPAPRRLGDAAAAFRAYATDDVVRLDRSVARAIDSVWLRGGDEHFDDLKRRLGDSIFQPDDARQIHEIGRRVDWVEADDDARLARIKAIVAQIAKARAAGERDRMLVAALLMGGAGYHERSQAPCIILPGEPPAPPPPKPPPPDAASVNRRIDELLDVVAGR